MAITFPTTLDALTNPTSTDNLNTAGVLHDVQHSDLNDAIEAIEAKLGINPSGPTLFTGAASHDALIRDVCFDIRAYGAIPDTIITNGVTTAASSTITGPAGTWVAGDVGKSIWILNAATGERNFTTTIATVAGGGASITVANAVTKTKATAVIGWGGDNTTAIQAAINAAAAGGGGRVLVPPGAWLTNQLVLGNLVWLEGTSTRGSMLRFGAGQNVPMIINLVAPTAADQNAEFTGVRYLTLEGNRDRQTGAVSHGINLTSNPTFGSGATNDYEFDTHHVLDHLFVWNCDGEGVKTGGRSAMTFYNVYAYYNRLNGFNLGFDTFITSCHAGQNGECGFYSASTTIHIINCAAFYNGQATGTNGYGFHWDGNSQGGIHCSNLLAQDNQAAGYRLNSVERATFSCCVADSNSRYTLGTYAGFELNNSNYNILEACTAFDRYLKGTEDGPPSNGGVTVAGPSQMHAFKTSGTCLSNRASMNHSLHWDNIYNISSSTNATPTVITTSAIHNMTSGQFVKIANHATNLAANGFWKVTVLSTTTVSLQNPLTGADLAATAAGGATGTMTVAVGGPVHPTSVSVDNNDLRFNGQFGKQTMAAPIAGASWYPDPYGGHTIEVALTANIIVKPPQKRHDGLRMAFIFKQDATGGRTVTFTDEADTWLAPNAVINLQANAITGLEFYFDGVSWSQTSNSPFTKVMRGTAVWDPAAISNGANVNTTVTVTGAAVGDAVAVGFSVALTIGMILTAHVSAANTVTVLLHNISAGASVNLASGTLTAYVFKA
jgi:hypothetical protein